MSVVARHTAMCSVWYIVVHTYVKATWSCYHMYILYISDSKEASRRFWQEKMVSLTYNIDYVSTTMRMTSLLHHVTLLGHSMADIISETSMNWTMNWHSGIYSWPTYVQSIFIGIISTSGTVNYGLQLHMQESLMSMNINTQIPNKNPQLTMRGTL